jgi:hypothetical protein
MAESYYGEGMKSSLWDMCFWKGSGGVGVCLDWLDWGTVIVWGYNNLVLGV